LFTALWTPQPATASEGNAPGLAVVRLDGDLGAALVARQDWLRKRAALAPRPQGPMQFIDNLRQVEVLESSGSLTFDVSKGQVQSASQLTVKSHAASLSTVYLYVDQLSGSDLVVADPGGPLAVSPVGQGVSAVSLRKALAQGETVTLTTTASGAPPCGGQQSICGISPSMTYSMAATWQPLVYDLVVQDLATPKTVTVDLRLPSTMVVAANGSLTGTTPHPDGTVTHSFEYPGPQYFFFAAAPFLTGATPFGQGQDARSYLLGANAGQAAAWRDAAVDILSFHGQRYGAYDLPKLDLVEMPDTTGAAGIGAFGAVFVMGAVLAPGPAKWYDRTTLAHELSHQWFGGYVDLDEKFSPWLNEGFATFAETEYTASLLGKETGADARPLLRHFGNLEYVYGVRGGKDVALSSWSLYDAPTEIYVVVTYDKGGLVAGMLRYLVGGDAPFFAAMKKYRKDHLDQGATVKSLGASIQGATGKKVDDFLSAWAGAAGYPVFSVGAKRSAGPKGFSVEVSVTADKDPLLPVELDLVLAGGQRERKSVTLSGKTATATFETSDEVIAVVFDPEHQIAGRAHGSLGGDIQLNGEVDGIDLLYGAWAMGRKYKLFYEKPELGTVFPDWADLIFDGTIDQKDLDLVLGAFGKRAGQGG
jgi:hypothetical protein